MIEDPERGSFFKVALDFFRKCGYRRDQYEQSVERDDGKVCFIIPGEGQYCLAPGEVRVTEERY